MRATPGRVAVAAGRASLAVATAYLATLTVAAMASRRRMRSGAAANVAPTRRFTVLIPAHDEERLIGSTLSSIASAGYPRDLVAIHVVADNCQDATAELARSAGANVHERHDPGSPGKGPALQWLIARLRAGEGLGDAVVFLDADTTVAPGFFGAIDRALESGASVVQAHYAVRDPESGPVVGFRAAAMAARTYLRPLGRAAIGGSAGLHGNGMVFRPDILEHHGWSNHLTEDVELHLDLLLDGVLVGFAADARVNAEMPETLDAARSQHERWERGRLQVAATYVPRLMVSAVGGGRLPRRAYLDAALDQLVPPFSVLVAGTAAWNGLAMLGRLARTARIVHGGRPPKVAMPATVAVTQAAYVLVALRLVGAPAAVYRSLLAAPRMVAWKLVLWIRVLARPRRAAWTRTARNE